MEIELPDGTVLDAPDDADPSAVAKAYLAKQGSGKQKPLLGPWTSAAVRPLAKAVAGVPLMAMDAGVGTRNFLTGENYELPSTMFNRALDTYTSRPEGAGQAAEFVSTAIAGAKFPAPQAVRQAPKNFMAPRDLAKDTALRAAQKEGYVVPPSSNNPTVLNRVLEGIAGKVKLNQDSVIRNQGATDQLASRGIEQGIDAPITTRALDVIRKEAFQKGYEPLRSVGTVNAGDGYVKALDSVRAAAKGAERSFPGLTKGDPVEGLVEALRQPTFDSADAVDAIKILRQNADDAYRAGNRSLGRSNKAAAKALEDAIESELKSRGDDSKSVLQAFRQARTLIAKTHTAEKGLVGDSGASNARAYVTEAMKKPLSGDQKKIADFASQFGKFTPKPTGENFTPLGPLDVYGSAGLSVGMDSVLPFAYPLSRIGLRQYLLSPQGQQMALRKTADPRKTLGLLGGLIPQAEQGLVGQ